MCGRALNAIGCGYTEATLGAALGVGLDLLLELDDRLVAGPRDRLVGVDDDPLEADRVAQGHQRRHELHRRAVGVRDDALVPREVVGVDLRHDQRDVRVHPPRRRVVDHGRAAGRGLGRELLRRPAAGAEQRDVDALERVRRRQLDLEVPPADRDPAPGRPLRCQEPQLGHREGLLEQDLRHRAADGAGRADDGDGQGFRGGISGMVRPSAGWLSGTGGVYQRVPAVLGGPFTAVSARTIAPGTRTGLQERRAPRRHMVNGDRPGRRR